MMKKSIFAVAVASVLTLGAAQAETVLYGSIRYDYENKKNEFGDTTLDANGKAKRVSNLSDAGSRIGIKGSEDLGNGNAVIYNLEWGFDGMTQDESKGAKTRKAMLGLTGDWGTFVAGRQNNPFYDTLVDGSVVDDFNGSNVIKSAAQRAMTTTLNPGANPYDASFTRVGKVAAYITPEFAGFQASAAIMMDDSLYAINDEKNLDLWTINAKYAYDFGANGTLTAKAGYIQGKLADTNKSKAWGLFLGYSQDSFGVTAAYADGNHKNVGADHKEKSKGWDLGASFSFGPNYFSTVRANYGENQVKLEGNKEKVKSWAVGFEQKLSTRTRAWVEYGQEKYHDNADKPKNNVISVGMRHDF
ncbi:porin [Ignatzschineria rhizosphaerae]|uniref:Porin n=1 Tax=Ignatzschineria rhizosphaerae TaxID=2923279 RepID=A0ABY3X0B3_9GAMM|nr:porin [Ignatzschineria rhizosphaerae]UNM96323.1 porin [Ignatzschineria rhizosphaerae]